jgi:hypothetical protein
MPISKAVAVHTTVIVIMIAFFAVFAFFLLYQWVNGGVKQASEMSCVAKRTDFCLDWNSNNYGTKPWNWQDQDPKTGCEAYQVTEPTADACRTLLHG